MKMKRFVLLFFHSTVLLCCAAHLKAQDYYNPESLVVNENKVYDENIRTIRVLNVNSNYTMPILDLGGDDKLLIKFDDLSAEITDYSYTLFHCDENWEKTSLTFFEYASGMQQLFVDDYDYSRNTLQKYIHYQFTVPNDDIKLKISGNYMLMVYKNHDPEQVVFSQRIMVVEQRASVQMELTSGDMPSYRFSHQELDFSLSFEDYAVGNALENLHVVLLQNRRWDNAIKDIKPLFIRNNVLEYTYDEENTFTALNEYRMVDTRTIRESTETTRFAKVVNDSNYTFLEQGEVPTRRRFRTTADLNGRFTVQSYEGFAEGNLDADYSLVHFEVAAPKLPSNADVVIFGDAFQYTPFSKRRLELDEESQLWKGDFYLKQGLIDYMLAINEDGVLNAEPLEGSYSDSENEYYILVYHKRLYDNYTRLVGYGQYEIGAW